MEQIQEAKRVNKSWRRAKMVAGGVIAGMGMMLTGLSTQADAAVIQGHSLYGVIVPGMTPPKVLPYTGKLAKGEFRVMSLSYGLTTNFELQSAARPASRSSLKPITLTKAIDGMSTTLFADSLMGKAVSGSIDLQDVTNGKAVAVMVLSFTGMISSFSESVAYGDAGSEEITISPMTETLTVTPVSQDGKVGQSTSVTYDAVKNKVTMNSPTGVTYDLGTLKTP